MRLLMFIGAPDRTSLLIFTEANSLKGSIAPRQASSRAPGALTAALPSLCKAGTGPSTTASAWVSSGVQRLISCFKWKVVLIKYAIRACVSGQSPVHSSEAACLDQSGYSPSGSPTWEPTALPGRWFCNSCPGTAWTTSPCKTRTGPQKHPRSKDRLPWG